ncbi:MAG: hypothetical protein ACOYL1_05010 [Chlamydiia bacterium]|jgi:hypothetical protein
MIPVSELNARIICALSEIKSYECKRVETSLNASPRKASHNEFLESIRRDLIHFDPDKKERLKFSIERFVRKAGDASDQDFCFTMERVLELVLNFQNHHIVLKFPKSV